jgi:hypothetical protein
MGCSAQIHDHCHERTSREPENETPPETWESKNEALRRIGLRTIANPKEQE